MPSDMPLRQTCRCWFQPGTAVLVFVDTVSLLLSLSLIFVAPWFHGFRHSVTDFRSSEVAQGFLYSFAVFVAPRFHGFLNLCQLDHSCTVIVTIEQLKVQDNFCEVSKANFKSYVHSGLCNQCSLPA